MLTLLYHNVLRAPANLPVAEGQVTVETLRRHIHALRKHLLHPLDVQAQLSKGKTPRGILVSFDDGAEGIVEAGRILSEVGAAGVAFICPGAVKKGLWFYQLADALSRSTASCLKWSRFDLPLTGPAERRKAYRELSTELFDLPARIRDYNLAEITAALCLPAGNPDPALTTLDNTSVYKAAKTGGLVFANHSWSHPNLVTISAAELKHELEAAQSWLESSGLPVLPWFAFPRGNHDARVRRIVAQSRLLAFGAKAFEPEPGVLPRTYIGKLDSRRIRFMAKTAWEGRLRRHFFWR